MQQRTGSIAGFYRAQVESAQDLTTASMEGFERIQQLALQALRQQLDNQFRLVNTVAQRSAEAVVDPELARPALDRIIDVQRQMAETFVRTNQRVLSAVNSSAQRTVEQGSALASNGEPEYDYTAMVQGALQQWQELTNRMLDVFHQQFAAATGDIEGQAQRAFAQGSDAVQGGARDAQAGAEQGQRGASASTQPAGQSQGAGRPKTPERKHEMA